MGKKKEKDAFFAKLVGEYGTYLLIKGSLVKNLTSLRTYPLFEEFMDCVVDKIFDALDNERFWDWPPKNINSYVNTILYFKTVEVKKAFNLVAKDTTCKYCIYLNSLTKMCEAEYIYVYDETIQVSEVESHYPVSLERNENYLQKMLLSDSCEGFIWNKKYIEFPLKPNIVIDDPPKDGPYCEVKIYTELKKKLNIQINELEIKQKNMASLRVLKRQLSIVRLLHKYCIDHDEIRSIDYRRHLMNELGIKPGVLTDDMKKLAIKTAQIIENECRTGANDE